MGTRQHTGAYRDLAHIARGTAIDSLFSCDNTTTHDFLFQFAEGGLNVCFTPAGLFICDTFTSGQCFHSCIARGLDRILALQLVSNLVGCSERIG